MVTGAIGRGTAMQSGGGGRSGAEVVTVVLPELLEGEEGYIGVVLK